LFFIFSLRAFLKQPARFLREDTQRATCRPQPPEKNVIATKPDVFVLTIGEQIKVVENARIHNRVGAMATPEFSIALVR
jgi:hypothetical protein